MEICTPVVDIPQSVLGYFSWPYNKLNGGGSKRVFFATKAIFVMRLLENGRTYAYENLYTCRLCAFHRIVKLNINLIVVFNINLNMEWTSQYVIKYTHNNKFLNVSHYLLWWAIDPTTS